MLIVEQYRTIPHHSASAQSGRFCITDTAVLSLLLRDIEQAA